MNKNNQFEKVAHLPPAPAAKKATLKEQLETPDEELTKEDMDSINKKIIKQNIPKNLSEKKTEQQLAKEQEIREEAA